MEIKLEAGIKGEQSTIVDKNSTAKNVGSGSMDVFATPAMIALMEQTAHNSVANFLPKEMTSVGIEINVKHIKATALGKQVKCLSVLEKTEGKRLYFTIEAFDEEGKIGEANHIRYIVETEKFLERLR
jgi:predicted thioesterase